MYLVLIETSGNQNYIFLTNKLKENIGASELTYRAGTKWVLEAVEKVSISNKCLSLFPNAKQLRDNLLDKILNPSIDINNDVKVEVIVATSGKALLLTKTKDIAQKIIQYVTHKALIEAPGLDICGVISDDFNWDEKKLGDVNTEIHQKFATVRSKRPAPDLRFLRLPIIDECSTSGLPASELDFDSENKSVMSVVSSSKRHSSEEGLKRIRELLKQEKPDIDFPSNIRELVEYLDNQPGIWLSVIHADGNGLGEIFLKFQNFINNQNQSCAVDNRNYVDKLRRFSIALDICTEKAFISALDVFKSTDNKEFAKIIPLVLGGDDLTVVCDGKVALRFTQLFLNAFEKETHENQIISEIAKEALKVPRLSACAGIAIIKPKFPFSVAYKLAENLMQSAKDIKKKVTYPETGKPYPCSALDFHILYDSSSVDFKSIRDKIEKKEENIVIQKLHNRPYVVTSEDNIQEAKGLEWAKFHQFSKLEAKIKVLLAKDENDGGKRKLPNSQMHDLKAGLFLGKEVADARYLLIRDRYQKQNITTLGDGENSLFEKEPDSAIDITGLLDAIDAAEFLNIEDEKNEQKEST